MERRAMLAGLAGSLLVEGQTARAESPFYLELRFWRLHNTAENQAARLADYLENGLAPALERAGGRLAGAFSTVIGPASPQYVTLAQFSSLAVFQQTWEKLRGDTEHTRALENLDRGPGLPFVRVESSFLRSFDVMPQPAIERASKPRVFELRCYESQSFRTLSRKVAMFNNGEADIFKRLGFRPVFFGETIAGPAQPNLMYMLSYDDLAARDRLWGAFGSDPEWKKLSHEPGLSDAEIVENISNVILSGLPFSSVR
jgi:hypothetical protein